MSDNIAWSEDVLPESEQAQDNWVEPPEFAPSVPAGKYIGYVDAVTRQEQISIEGVGQRWFATFDVRIVGGEYDERVIKFAQVNNVSRTRKMTGTVSSQGLDMLKSAGWTGPLRTNVDYKEALLKMKELGPAMKFGFQCDWRGWCQTCYGHKLMQLTGADNADAAKAVATKSQKAEAGEFAEKASNYSRFPDNPGGKGKKDSFLCPNCGETVRAKVQVLRYMRPTY
jgi:hypothetical protein